MANTRIMLSLPADAARRLARDFTPEQLSKMLGVEVLKVDTVPNKMLANNELHVLGCQYYDSTPWNEIDAILARNGFDSVGDIAPYEGGRYRQQVHKGQDLWLTVSLYRMPSGKYEVTAYVN